MKMTDDDKKAIIAARLGKALNAVASQGFAAGEPEMVEGVQEALAAHGLKLSLAPVAKVAP